MQCARYAFGLSGIYDEDEGSDIAAGRIKSSRVIGSVSHAPAESASPILEMSEEESAQRAEIHSLCQELGFNSGSEDMMICQQQGNLPALIETLKEQVEQHKAAERAEIDKATKREEKSTASQSEERSSTETSKANGKGKKGLF